MFSNNYMAKRQHIMQAVGMGLQIAGTIGANIDAGKTRRSLKYLGTQDPTYTQSPYAQKELGLAQTLYNGRMAGASTYEAGIQNNQANTIANAQRNATDASQLQAVGANAQAQTNDAYGKLALMEAGDQQQRYQNLVAGQRGMTAEHQALFDDKVRRWQDQLGILMKRNEIKQQQWSNVNNLGSSISGMGSMGFGGGGGGQ